MAEIVVQFSNQRNGYDKNEVNQFVKDAEAKLQEKALALATTQQQVTELEARLAKLTAGDLAVEEKAVLYDRLMKKMDGDYENLLRPAIAKARAIEEKAENEYAIRLDQARATAEEIYAVAVERIAETVDENLIRVYALMDDFIYSKSLRGRVEAFVGEVQYATEKLAGSVAKVGKASCVAYRKVKGACKTAKARVQEKAQEQIVKHKTTITKTIRFFH